jgi:hypothetical protein
MRVMCEIKISTDDTIPIYISYPSMLTAAELQDLKAVVAIWIRGLERQVDAPWCPKCFAALSDPPKGDQ